jgi:hypothetical protein
MIVPDLCQTSHFPDTPATGIGGLSSVLPDPVSDNAPIRKFATAALRQPLKVPCFLNDVQVRPSPSGNLFSFDGYKGPSKKSPSISLCGFHLRLTRTNPVDSNQASPATPTLHAGFKDTGPAVLPNNWHVLPRARLSLPTFARSQGRVFLFQGIA